MEKTSNKRKISLIFSILYVFLMLFFCFSIIACGNTENDSKLHQGNILSQRDERNETTDEPPIDPQEFAVQWNMNGFILNNGVYEITYNGSDFLSQIFIEDNLDERITFFVTKSGINTGQIVDVGVYKITAICEDDSYTLTNNVITVSVLQASVDVKYEFYIGDEVSNIQELTTENNSIDYASRKVTIFASYSFGEVSNSLDVEIKNSSGNVSEIKDCDTYTIKITELSDNFSFNNSEITFTVKKRDVYIVSDSYAVDYNGEIKDEETISFSIYDSYSAETLEKGNEIIDDILKEELSDFVAFSYKKENVAITVEDIIAERNDWIYSAGNTSKTYTICLSFSDASNFNLIGIENGSLTINLEEITVTYVINESKNVNRTYYQAQKVNISEMLTEYGVVGDTITNWYIDAEEVEGEYKFTSDVSLYCYKIYRVYYMSETADNLNTVINSKIIKFHKYSRVTLPNSNHYIGVPSRFSYTFSGWTYEGNSINSMTTNGINKDIYLYPKFKINEYKILVSTRTTDFDNVNKKDYTELTTRNITFTLNDFDSEKIFELTHNEIEGYHFSGWFYDDGYSTKKLASTFKVSDFIKRDDIEIKGNSIIITEVFELYKCTITLIVGNKTVTSETVEIGSKINDKYFSSIIDRKFGFIYLMSDVPDVANSNVIIIRVQEIPLLWIILGAGVVITIVSVIIVKYLKKRKSEVDKKKLDIVLNRLDKD